MEYNKLFSSQMVNLLRNVTFESPRETCCNLAITLSFLSRIVKSCEIQTKSIEEVLSLTEYALCYIRFATLFPEDLCGGTKFNQLHGMNGTLTLLTAIPRLARNLHRIIDDRNNGTISGSLGRIDACVIHLRVFLFEAAADQLNILMGHSLHHEDLNDYQPFNAFLRDAWATDGEKDFLTKMSELQFANINLETLEILQILEFSICNMLMVQENMDDSVVCVILYSIDCVLRGTAIQKLNLKGLTKILKESISNVKKHLELWTERIARKYQTSNMCQYQLLLEKRSDIFGMLDCMERNNVCGRGTLSGEGVYLCTHCDFLLKIRLTEENIYYLEGLTWVYYNNSENNSTCILIEVFKRLFLLERYIENYSDLLSKKFRRQTLTTIEHLLHYARCKLPDPYDKQHNRLPTEKELEVFRNAICKMRSNLVDFAGDSEEDNGRVYRLEICLNDLNSFADIVSANINSNFEQVPDNETQQIVSADANDSRETISEPPFPASNDQRFANETEEEFVIKLWELLVGDTIAHDTLQRLLTIVTGNGYQRSLQSTDVQNDLTHAAIYVIINCINAILGKLVSAQISVSDIHIEGISQCVFSLNFKMLSKAYELQYAHCQEGYYIAFHVVRRLHDLAEHSDDADENTLPTLETGPVANSSESKLWNKLSTQANVNAVLHRKPDKCPVCINSMSREDNIAVFDNCTHLVCSVCTASWFAETNQCPVCRAVTSSWTTQEYFVANLGANI